MATDMDRVIMVATRIKCGPSLARDLLLLAGDDATLVYKASEKCHGVESVKAYIIDQRIRKLEKKN